jgi:prolyl 4-hydroxylase
LRTPRIFVVEKFASPEFCDWLIARAKPYLFSAREFDAQSGFGLNSQARNNSLANFDLFRLDLIFFIVWARISAVTEIPSGAEPPNIFHYAVGESYDQHFDYIEYPPRSSNGGAEITQRVVTFLLYLNDDYEGGGTEFPNVNWGYKGRKGDAMFFWNVDATGAPDETSLHIGAAPTAGEKWILSQWIQGRLALG